MSILSEKEVERLCDDLVEKHQGRVVRYSQSRATRQTEGIADREYFVFGLKLRFELKREDGKLSLEQLALLTLEYDAGGLVCCGGLDELRHMLVTMRASKDEARRLGWLFVQLWKARGLRRSAKR